MCCIGLNFQRATFQNERRIYTYNRQSDAQLLRHTFGRCYYTERTARVEREGRRSYHVKVRPLQVVGMEQNETSARH